jgi:hypothetical protein
MASDEWFEEARATVMMMRGLWSMSNHILTHFFEVLSNLMFVYLWMSLAV